jgi:hypothetical protein
VDMLRQALDMHALVIVCDVREEPELLQLKEALLDELKAHRLLIVVSGINMEGGMLTVPEPVVGACDTLNALSSVGLFMNGLKLSDRLVTNLFRRVRSGSEDTSYYRLTRKLHIASSELGRGAMQELQDLLANSECTLQALDLSFTQADGWSLVQSLKNNTSLTSLNLLSVPKMDVMYENISTLLFAENSKTRLGYLRCDAFDLPEGTTVLSLRETTVQPVAMRLLAALLKHNTTLQELDLTATDIEKDGATALASALESNSTLHKLLLPYNPALDERSKSALSAAAEKYLPNLVLEL